MEPIELRYLIHEKEHVFFEKKVWQNLNWDAEDEQYDDMQTHCIICFEPIKVTDQDFDHNTTLFYTRFTDDPEVGNSWCLSAHNSCASKLKVVSFEDATKGRWVAGKLMRDEHFTIITFKKED